MADRREGRTFEPPPWEREQFDALVQQRETGPDDSELDSAISGLSQQEAPQEQKEPEPSRPAPKPAAPIDEARVLEMLAQLSAEEPRASEDLWRLGLLGSIVTGSIGLMMVVLGVVGMAKVAKAGPMGVLIASVLLLFGAGFCALAAWTGFRTLKQRGVL